MTIKPNGYTLNGGESTYQKPRYFVVEHATGIVRAAQSTLRGALNAETFRRLFEAGEVAEFSESLRERGAAWPAK